MLGKLQLPQQTMTSHYKIRNWSDYNAGLISRGRLHVWLDEAVLATWKNTEKTGSCEVGQNLFGQWVVEKWRAKHGYSA